jgi:hypothetical protein
MEEQGMGNAKNIYKVKDGQLVSAEIIRETPKLYWIERGEGFVYGTNFTKEHACITPEEAILEEYNAAVTKVGMMEEILKKAQERLAGALRLRKEYNV